MCNLVFISLFQVIYEDLPSNLCAIRDYVENQKASQSSEVCEQPTNSGQQNITSASVDDNSSSSADDFSDCNVQSSSNQRSRVPGLQRDIEVLKSELLKFVAEHGQEGFMPMRKQLRLHGRVDIEKAITRMGGFRKIATMMNLALAYKYRKPKGYWDNLENLQEEVHTCHINKHNIVCRFNQTIIHFFMQISRFQRSWGMDPSFMPSRKSFERVGKLKFKYSLSQLQFYSLHCL